MTALRDISAPPRQPTPTPVPRRELPFQPASSARPIAADHGGALTVDRLGLVPFEPTWQLQEELAEHRRAGHIGDRLLLLEHRPVYTIGRGGDEANLLATRDRLHQLGAEFFRIDRGGDITFHGPGQLVAYPIIALHDPLDLRRYVRALEEAVIRTAARFEVKAGRVDGLTGVWVDGERKLAAIGVRVRRGVTTHGLALNVSTDLRWFNEMIPCGIHGKRVTTLSVERGRPIPMAEVESALADELATSLGLRAVDGSGPDIGPAGASEG